MALKIRLFPVLILLCSQVLADTLPIWEIEGASNRVLLMGSVHYLRATDYPLPEGMLQAYELADSLVMEIDMDSLDPMSAQTALMSLGISPDGTTLKEALGADTYREAEQRATELGIPLALFDQFEPWFAALTITQLRMTQLGFDPAWGIETRFTQMAASDSKEIFGLETLEEQLGFMDNLDAQSQKEFLLESLEDAALVEEEIESIVAGWRTGDTDALTELMLEGFADTPKLEDALLLQRNRNWVEPIQKLLDQPDNFLIIVGAMHLVGEHSVIAMLENKGFKIRQLNDADLAN
jgi:uncharacterized protein YbaP (TraB family)